MLFHPLYIDRVGPSKHLLVQSSKAETLGAAGALSCVNIIIQSLKMSRCFIEHHSNLQQIFSITKFSK